MYSIFWKSIFISFSMVFLGVNIAFTFNLVNMVNPSSLTLNYPNYYFGFQSFISSFTDFFGNSSFLTGFSGLLRNYSEAISKIYEMYQSPISMIGIFTGNKPVWEVLSMIFALISFTNNIIVVFLLFFYVLLYALYFVFFAFSIISFIVAFFGGAFATPLPSTDWWDTGIIQLQSMAMLV